MSVRTRKKFEAIDECFLSQILMNSAEQACERVFGIPQMMQSSSSSSFHFELMKNTLPYQVLQEIDFSVTTHCDGVNINYNDNEIQQTYHNIRLDNHNIEAAMSDLVCETDDGIDFNLMIEVMMMVFDSHLAKFLFLVFEDVNDIQ